MTQDTFFVDKAAEAALNGDVKETDPVIYISKSSCSVEHRCACSSTLSRKDGLAELQERHLGMTIHSRHIHIISDSFN